jgi:hypothetical protein
MKMTDKTEILLPLTSAIGQANREDHDVILGEFAGMYQSGFEAGYKHGQEAGYGKGFVAGMAAVRQGPNTRQPRLMRAH